MGARTLAELLSRPAEDRPDALYVRYLAGGRMCSERSFIDTYRVASRWARLLVARGVRTGDPVVLCLPNGEDFVGAFFGTLLAGGIPAALSPPRGPMDLVARVLGDACRFLPSRLAVLPSAVADTLGAEVQLPSELSMLSAVGLDDGTDLVPPPAVGDTDIGVLQLTSGTCGRPKVVQLSHRAVCAQVAAVAERLRLDPEDDSAVSWLPLSHDMGLIGFLLTPAFIGRHVTLMPVEDFMLSPMRWVQALSDSRATITGAPPSAYAAAARFMRRRDAEQLDLSRLRVALVGAEPIERDAIRRFVDRFTPCGLEPTAVMPTYGLAESCLAVTMPSPGTGPAFDEIDPQALRDGRAVQVDTSSGRPVAAVGAPLSGVTVTIVGSEGRELPDRYVGEVTVEGPSVFSGYLHRPDDTAEALRNGRLHTGDLGYVVDGVLYVTGRRKEVLIVGGRNYQPDDLETMAADIAGVRARRVVAFSVTKPEQSTESIVVLIETGPADAGRELCRRVHHGLVEAGVPVDTVVGVPPKTVLRTDTGKKRRIACRDRYVAGELDG
jgi:acyl-CoA synthetase (AMP-forming)/AMP-acid ligase II